MIFLVSTHFFLFWFLFLFCSRPRLLFLHQPSLQPEQRFLEKNAPQTQFVKVFLRELPIFRAFLEPVRLSLESLVCSRSNRSSDRLLPKAHFWEIDSGGGHVRFCCSVAEFLLQLLHRPVFDSRMVPVTLACFCHLHILLPVGAQTECILNLFALLSSALPRYITTHLWTPYLWYLDIPMPLKKASKKMSRVQCTHEKIQVLRQTSPLENWDLTVDPDVLYSNLFERGKGLFTAGCKPAPQSFKNWVQNFPMFIQVI